jgi:hypothetical protein
VTNGLNTETLEKSTIGRQQDFAGVVQRKKSDWTDSNLARNVIRRSLTHFFNNKRRSFQKSGGNLEEFCAEQ